MPGAMNIIRNLLLIFVFVSIGFALGKFTSKNSSISSKPSVADGKGVEYIHVYYLHSAKRCASCNKIENMTKKILDTKFGKDMKDGKLKFSELNFQDEIGLAQLFDVLSSCVVVAREDSSKVLSYKRLDDVWTLKDKETEFDNYISGAVGAFLAEIKKDGK